MDASLASSRLGWQLIVSSKRGQTSIHMLLHDSLSAAVTEKASRALVLATLSASDCQNKAINCFQSGIVVKLQNTPV